MLHSSFTTLPSLRASAPWTRERDYSMLCALLRAIVLDDPHRYIALLAWCDSPTLVETIQYHRCATVLVDAIERFDLRGDRRCHALLDRLKPHLASDDGTSDLAIPVSERVTAVFRLAGNSLGGVNLRDMYLAAELLRAMSVKEREALRKMIAAEPRDATRLNGTVEFAASMAAIDWNGGLGARAYAAWLRRCGDIPLRLRTRAHAVEAFFALGGGLRHAANVLTGDARRPHEVVGRIGGSILSSFYALLLPRV